MIDAFTKTSRGAKERRELDQWDSRATEKLGSRAAKGLAVFLYLSPPFLTLVDV